jgi:hypothetical protein
VAHEQPPWSSREPSGSWLRDRRASWFPLALHAPHMRLFDRLATLHGLLGAFGECQVMAYLMAKRLFISPLMIRGFRGCCLLLARGHHT